MAGDDKVSNGFTFFRSYYEAAKELPDKQRLAFYDAIILFGIEGTETALSGAPKAMFTLVKPTLDKSQARATAGTIGGKSKAEANVKQNASKAEANVKQTRSDISDDKDKGYRITDEDKDKDKRNNFVVGGEARARARGEPVVRETPERFVTGEARARGEPDEIVDNFLENRDLDIDAYFGVNDTVKDEVQSFTQVLFERMSLRRPTEQDVFRVFNWIRDNAQTALPDGREQWEVTFSDDRRDLLMYAFEAAGRAGAAGNWNYIEAVLQKMATRGIRTLSQAKDFDCDREVRKDGYAKLILDD